MTDATVRKELIGMAAAQATDAGNAHARAQGRRGDWSMEDFQFALGVLSRAQRTAEAVADYYDERGANGGTKPEFRNAQESFEQAIREGRLSKDRSSPLYAGHYMYMGHWPKADGTLRASFKHRDTRKYIP
jgi:hypothetical protein